MRIRRLTSPTINTYMSDLYVLLLIIFKLTPTLPILMDRLSKKKKKVLDKFVHVLNPCHESSKFMKMENFQNCVLIILIFSLWKIECYAKFRHNNINYRKLNVYVLMNWLKWFEYFNQTVKYR